METRGGKRRFEMLEPIENDIIDVENEISETAGNVNDPKRRKTVPRILDGEFFSITSEIIEADGKVKVVAKCKICQEEKRGVISSTGNFIKHYQLKHDGIE